MWRLISGIFMGWSLGANDSANVFGTAVSSGLIRYKTAVLLCSLFVIAGSVLEGEKCIKVLNDLSTYNINAAFGITLAASITMTILTYLGLPASTSQALVGAVIGWSIIEKVPNFKVVYKVVLCWVLTPICAVFIGWSFYKLLYPLIKRLFKSLISQNRFFFWSVIIIGCYGSYTLGANNVANVTGVYVGARLLSPKVAALIGGLSISLGVLTYSKKVMFTVGKSIVPLDSFSAAISLFSEAATLHIFTQIGIPVSSSQAIVGGVIGVGVAKDISTVDLRVITKIFLGWVSTPLTAAFLSFIGRYLELWASNSVFLYSCVN